jgi:hypothetical protein
MASVEPVDIPAVEAVDILAVEAADILAVVVADILAVEAVDIQGIAVEVAVGSSELVVVVVDLIHKEQEHHMVHPLEVEHHRVHLLEEEHHRVHPLEVGHHMKPQVGEPQKGPQEEVHLVVGILLVDQPVDNLHQIRDLPGVGSRELPVAGSQLQVDTLPLEVDSLRFLAGDSQHPSEGSQGHLLVDTRGLLEVDTLDKPSVR